MRFLVFADLQATDGSEPSYTEPMLTLQQVRVQKFFQDLRTVYDEYGCEGVIDLGDTLDDRSSVPHPIIELVGAGLELIPDSQWNIKLVGNHDQYLRNATVNNRRLFEHKFTVVDSTAIFDQNGTPLVFCSYPAKHDDLARWVMATGHKLRSQQPILFGHFQLIGCQMSSGLALTGVPRVALKDYALSLLGHVHIPQTIGECIHYVGSPFQQEWGEAGQQKRVAVLDTHPLSLTWVPMTGYPEYRRIPFETFAKLGAEPDEHRYKVVLTSHEETEQFFQHPRFHMAEAEYSYDAAVPEEQKQEQDWSFEGICRRFLDLVAPAKAGIELNPEEMLEIGQSIARGECS
jgi:hypothetical protein